MKKLINSAAYMGKAWILDRRGTEIEVENHPSIQIGDEVTEFVKQYGNAKYRRLAESYLESKDENLLNNYIVHFYNETWCKVRVWGTFSEELTFRITSNDFNWYQAIVWFLSNHKELHNCIVTVETDKRLKSAHTYWDKVPVGDILNPENESVLSSKLIN